MALSASKMSFSETEKENEKPVWLMEDVTIAS
jgi:hypothetical protein